MAPRKDVLPVVIFDRQPLLLVELTPADDDDYFVLEVTCPYRGSLAPTCHHVNDTGGVLRRLEWSAKVRKFRFKMQGPVKDGQKEPFWLSKSSGILVPA